MVLLAAAGIAVVSLVAAAQAQDRGERYEPRCWITLTPAGGPYANRFSVRCNFEQDSIRIASDSRISDLASSPRLTGHVDAGDGFRCRVRGELVARCQGSAGSGARVAGSLRTKSRNCDVALRFRVTGGPDCRPGTACPAVAYVVRKSFEPRPDCA